MSREPEAGRLLFEVLNEIGIISQLARAQFESILPKGVLQPHFSVLNHLIRVSDGRTPNDLARAFQVPKTSMTHTLSGLEQRSWVELKPNPADGRSKLVWLTDEGRAFREQAIESMAPHIGGLIEALDLDDLFSTLPVLKELRETLDRLRD